MAEKLVQLKKKGGGVSGLTITDKFQSNRYQPETGFHARQIIEYSLIDCKSAVVNITTITSQAGSPYIEIRGDNTSLYTVTKGQTGSYSVDPSVYTNIEIYIWNETNANNINAVGNVVRTY